jgi:putative transposase
MTVLTGHGRVRIETPRDRDGSFEPLLLPEPRRFTAFDDSIVALYARGLTVREIQGYLAESYGTEVSPDLISTVTDSVLAEVTAWQARPLEAVYPVVFFWMKVFNDLKTRGVNDLLIAVTDGLTGMPAALAAVFSPDDVANLHPPIKSGDAGLQRRPAPPDRSGTREVGRKADAPRGAVP